jgi:hypothetical protein
MVYTCQEETIVKPESVGIKKSQAGHYSVGTGHKNGNGKNAPLFSNRYRQDSCFDLHRKGLQDSCRQYRRLYIVGVHLVCREADKFPEGLFSSRKPGPV